MEKSEETRQTYKCQFCEKCFIKFGQYFSHLKCEHPYELSFDCIICGSNFSVFKSYKAHFNIKHHSQADRFQCEKCPKTFRKYHLYKVHNNVVHLKIKAFKCNACGKAFGARDTLVKHVKRIHGLESIHAYHLDKIEKCNVCDKVFENESALNQHSNEKHTKTKNIPCEHCEKSFRSLKKLNKHMEKIQKEKDENENMKEPKIIVAVKPKNEVQNDAATNEFTKEEFKPNVNYDDEDWWKTF